MTPTNPLVTKLEQFTRLSSEDRAALEQHCCERVRSHEARADILREGERPHAVNLILSGWACRYKQLVDGKRQIIALMLPGDLCDHDVYVLREMDHSVAALTPVTLAEVTREAFAGMLDGHPRVARALAWDTLVTVATQREWTVNLGQRDALARLAHLFCEIYVRLRGLGLAEVTREGEGEVGAVGGAAGGSCDQPLTQTELAEATGMTPVHVNRMLQELRAKELVELRRKRLVIPDLAALMALAQFTPNYLHLGREGAQFDAAGGEVS